MKILITGGTGFIGSAVCEALGKEGHELIAITRDPIRAQFLIPAPHQSIKWDFSDSQPPVQSHLLQDVDAVIHLAGEPILAKRWNSEFKQRLYHSRVAHTHSLISLLKKTCKSFPKIFISASAVGFYGNRGDEILTETSQPGTDFLAHICQDWEEALCELPMEATRKVSLRNGIVLGKGGGALEKMLHPFSLNLGGHLGNGSQWMSWIHLEDLVSIVLEALKNIQITGPVNCCTPFPIPNREFTECLTKNLHTHKWVSIPKLALQAALGEGSIALLSSQRVAPTKLTQTGFSFKYPNLDSALAAILGESYSRGFSEFQKKCWLPLPIHEVFQFFSEASNLERITPSWLGFHILSQSSQEMKTGTTIDYRLKLHGIPLHWRTEIASWDPPYKFTDVQLKGPYQFWSHTHRFSELGDGTLMEDQVLYKLPMGFLGKLFGGRYARGDIGKIFEYRNRTIYNLLLNKKEGIFE